MKKKHLALAAIPVALLASCAFSYEKAFDTTKPGKVEIKDIPALIALEASEDGAYFDKGNNTFMKLFRYISANDVKMTTPVSVDVDEGTMRFFVGTKDQKKGLENTETVKVVEIPARTVVSIAYRGGYHERNYTKHVSRLTKWLETNPSWEAAGEPVAVYWNGPMMPSAMKHAVVMIPVKAVPSSEDAEKADENESS